MSIVSEGGMWSACWVVQVKSECAIGRDAHRKQTSSPAFGAAAQTWNEPWSQQDLMANFPSWEGITPCMGGWPITGIRIKENGAKKQYRRCGCLFSESVHAAGFFMVIMNRNLRQSKTERGRRTNNTLPAF